VVGGSLWGGSEGERGGLAVGLGERVLVVDLVVGLVVGTGARAQGFEDECVVHGCGGG
jgi:hypothetical protein